MHLLIVEDDYLVQKLLRKGLESEGYVVDIVGTGAEGVDFAVTGQYDAVILDVRLPDMDGITVARLIRETGVELPMLMLTARAELHYRLAGFAAGADDYLVKPFAFQELLARLRAITRRSGPLAADKLAVGDLILDRRAHEVRRVGRPVRLSPKEFALLELLMEHPGQVLSRAVILDRIWDSSFDGFSNVVETSIKRLRRAIDAGHSEKLIQTVHGVGYKIAIPHD